ncbi:MAG: hypothetical protein CMJ81_07000 [Planctomycetaceae bacterium]|nr:hypothetical protein [Planctomycetaceae bacterium]MBP61201.1 hypothetical protein [Planctomycetaceae bacterium]
MTSLPSTRALVLVVAGSIALSGCAAIKRQAGKMGDKPLSVSDLHLTYRTETDRLNVAQSSNHVLLATHQAPAANALPACSIGIVNIVYPHPEGRKDVARVRVVFRASGTETAVLNRSMWKKIFDLEEDTDVGKIPEDVLEVWTMDVPKSHLDRTVGRLKKAQFFRKQLVILNPETFLAIDMEGEIAVGKNYRSVDELDLLVMRIRREGQLIYSPQPVRPVWRQANLPPLLHAPASQTPVRLPAITSY